MITILGVILLVAPTLLLVFVTIDKKQEPRYQNLKPLHKLSKLFYSAVTIFGIIILLSGKLFMMSEQGYSYLLVHPSGQKSAVMTPGIKWRGFAKVYEWQKYIDLKVLENGEDGSEVEGKMKPIPIRFVDKVTAEVKVSARFQIPEDEPSFIKMAVEFRSLSNLVNNTLIPTVNEVVSNTGYMFSAEDYVSGSASDFRVAVDDQIKLGSYKVERVEYKDTLDTKIQNNSRQRKILEVQTRTEVIKRRDSNGIIVRIDHDIKKNNIKVAQVIIQDVVLEPVFKQRLEAQRDESAKRQLEQQKIQTAKDAQQRIIAEGERDKAEERAKQEQEQVKQLISIETKLKQEETQKELAKISLETEKLRAQAERVKAEAESYKNAKLVSAGLTPQERAKIEMETKIGVAKELAKIKFPETMIVGGSSKSATPLESLIGAAMAKQLGSK